MKKVFKFLSSNIDTVILVILILVVFISLLSNIFIKDNEINIDKYTDDTVLESYTPDEVSSKEQVSSEVETTTITSTPTKENVISSSEIVTEVPTTSIPEEIVTSEPEPEIIITDSIEEPEVELGESINANNFEDVLLGVCINSITDDIKPCISPELVIDYMKEPFLSLKGVHDFNAIKGDFDKHTFYIETRDGKGYNFIFEIKGNKLYMINYPS